MNKNTTAILLIIIAIAIFFTFTRGRIAELREIQAVNAQYDEAIKNSNDLVKVRDDVLAKYNSITEENKQRLNKLVPDNVDNVRLIIDVKDDIAARHGLFLKNLKTASPEAVEKPTNTPGQVAPPPSSEQTTQTGEKYGVATLSFTVTSKYEDFVDFLKDLEASLRIMDITRLDITANDKGTFDFSVDLKTYWLKQK